jgi:hypothetical protein
MNFLGGFLTGLTQLVTGTIGSASTFIQTSGSAITQNIIALRAQQAAMNGIVVGSNGQYSGQATTAGSTNWIGILAIGGALLVVLIVAFGGFRGRK